MFRKAGDAVSRVSGFAFPHICGPMFVNIPHAFLVHL